MSLGTIRMHYEGLSRTRSIAIDLIRKLRPAPVSNMLLTCLGLNRRRTLPHANKLFYVDPTSVLARNLLAGRYEEGTHAALEKYLSPGATFLDLGANEGYFTVLASDLVGPAGQVIAVEPQSRLLPILLKNLELNVCYNCRVLRCALSDQNGTVRLHLLPATNTGGTSLYRPTRYPVSTEAAPSWTLADFLGRLGVEAVDLAKVDIEGAECSVFMPAGRVLRSGILKNIVLEYHESALRRQGSSPDQIHSHLLACGYRFSDATGAKVYEFVKARVRKG